MVLRKRALAYVDRAINRALRFLTYFRHGQLESSFGIESHITLRERVKLNSLAVNRAVIVEIGSYVGASAAAMASASRPLASKIYCIDTWENDAMSEGKRSTKAEFEANVRPHLEDIVMLKGYSQNLHQALASKIKHADLLFIDGDHSYEGVHSDWVNYSPLLKSGSCVVFHDYGWAEGVQRVVHDDVLPRVGKWGKLPNLWWGMIH